MRIKIAILDQDQMYLTRLMTAFGKNYADKVEVYLFTEQETAMKALEQSKINVFLAEESFKIEEQQVPRRCSFAYLTSDSEIASIRDISAICKYQKVELIYKSILSLYAERSDLSINGVQRNDGGRIILFAAPCGGAGTSTSAAACARFFAKQGKKVLYLNLEKFGGADSYFQGDGQFTMSDLIYAIKSKSANIQFKMEAILRQSAVGVYFIAQPTVALDMCELQTSEVKDILAAAIGCGFQYIVLDCDFSATSQFVELISMADIFVVATDGSPIGNQKLIRGISALNLLHEQEGEELADRMALIYSKCSNQCQVLDDIKIDVLGTIPRYKATSTEQIMEEILAQGVYNKLLER